jgi:GNAT superfamily N-acetyltransferase
LLAVWTEQLSERRSDHRTILAECDGAVVGFGHTVLEDDATWGALLDNLHVTHTLKWQGIGTQLMAETAKAVLERRPSEGLYLWVLEQNTAAQAFYEARGGRRVGQKLGGPFPGGGTAMVLRYAWPDPSSLLIYE